MEQNNINDILGIESSQSHGKDSKATENNNDSDVKLDFHLPQKTLINYGDGAISVLDAIAWITFLLGNLGAIIILATMSTIPDTSRYALSTDTLVNPNGIILGIALLFASVITSTFLWVVCGIARNIIAIRKNSEERLRSIQTTNQ
jgi:hypothetical protein